VIRWKRAFDGRPTLAPADASYLGPQAPAGKQGNWLATVPGKGYFAILRLDAAAG